MTPDVAVSAPRTAEDVDTTLVGFDDALAELPRPAT